MCLVRYPLSHLASLMWLSPSSLTDMLCSQGILVKDGCVWWSANQDDKDSSNSTLSQSCHYEQIGFKVREVKDQLDRLVLGETNYREE